ncbi:MAG: DUF3131 domain-containing protein [Cryomorphaceae bacterium]|nr:DUF3131 domain-containing protein [Cryomorphaceae bacterium]
MSNISFNIFVKPILFILGLAGTIWMVLWIETVRPSDFGFYKDIFQRESIIESRSSYPLRKTGEPLTEEEMDMARIAWKYFINNFQHETGFTNSVDKYHSTTLWDLSSSLFATVSAFELGIIEKGELHYRVEKTLQSLSSIQLYNDHLPNKVYNTINLNMSTYDNRPTDAGVGWSSMDIGRFLNFCTRLIHNYPEFTSHVNRVINHWDLSQAIEDGELIGIGLSFKDGREMRVQEGKLGYEEYCAKGFQSMLYDVSNAMKYTDFIKFVNVHGEQIAVDSREVKYHPAYNYVVSDPYILDGLERGFDINSLELGYRIFRAQKKHYEKTGIVTAVGESHIDTVPYFVYNSIYVNGKTWHCVSESGDDANEFKSLSTAAAIGWAYLFDDDYADLLKKTVKDLYEPNLGFYGGIFDKDGRTNTAITANVNAMVLQALNYKKYGPILKSTRK